MLEDTKRRGEVMTYMLLHRDHGTETWRVVIEGQRQAIVEAVEDGYKVGDRTYGPFQGCLRHIRIIAVERECKVCAWDKDFLFAFREGGIG